MRGRTQVAVLLSLAPVSVLVLRAAEASPVSKDAWQPAPSIRVGGVLGERIRLWRERRLWRVVEDPFLLRGFEAPPGTHPWQGEHVGKWLHAATLAYQDSRDARILRVLQETVGRLLASQQDNGYIGTYAGSERFFAPPGKHTRYSWDVWTARYVIYGLLAYEKFHPDPAIVKACTRLGDLLLATYGPGRTDLTTVGSRHGMSSTVLLESVVALYERTGERRFLEFARHIHQSMEANPKIRLLATLSGGGDVSTPGDGKAYQMMSTLLGYGGLYRHTGEKPFLDVVSRAWEVIRKDHTLETGGPWSYKADKIKNHECFTDPKLFHPTNLVETCSTTTWVQLSLQLLQITGQAEYGAEAERAMLNALLAAQSPNGRDWAYFTAANIVKRDYNDVIHCCGSSGPRALEVYARHLVGASGGAVSLNSYLPLEASLSGLNLPASAVRIEGNYPYENRAVVRVEVSKPARFPVDFRMPAGADRMEIAIDGAVQQPERTSAGFLRLNRTWKPGETVRIAFRFPLRAAINRARDGRTWVAFTYGPLALAQGLATPADDAEIQSPAASALNDGASWLDPLRADGAGPPQFRIKGTPIVLMPYFVAGSDGSSVRTYFPVQSAAARPAAAPAAAEARLGITDYEDRVKAAWVGQIIGAMLGMQFEHKPAAVKFTDTFAPNEITKRGGKDNFAAPVDDDYFYEIVALRAFEKYGIGTTVEQLGRQWVENSAGAYGSSEYTRLLLARGIRPPDTGHPRYNPLWYTIGAQFSSDIYGLLAPGMPNVAGKLARELGHINGYAEGADGAVFVAGMVSLAFTETNPQSIVRNAARLIDPRSPYRQSVDMVIRMAEAGHSADEIASAIEDRYRVEYAATNNAVPNGAIVALSVWFGEGDYLKTVNVAFRAGDFTDADCNAANAGAVIAAMGGMKRLPAHLVKQVGDRVQGSKLGVALTPPVDESVTDLAKRTAAIGRKIVLANGGRTDGALLLIPLEPVKTQAPELFRLADLMQYWNPDWRLERAAVGGTSGGWKGLLGMTCLNGDVLITTPRDRVRGVVLRRTTTLGADPSLTFDVGADPDRAWQLLVYVDHTLLMSQIIEGKGRERTWVPVRVPLEAYAGKTVTLRLYQSHQVRNRIPGDAYWRAIRLD